MEFAFAKPVDILGTQYLIEVRDNDRVFNKNKAFGYCNTSAKKIIIRDLVSKKEDADGKRDSLIFMKKTVRHEIVHAFMQESGLGYNTRLLNEAWATNEEMVDWFALQGPKIMKVWNDIGVLNDFDEGGE